MSTAQLLAGGWTTGRIAHGVRRGRLHRKHRGVYAVGHGRLDATGRAWAALLACGAGAVVSHRSAGQVWELPVPRPPGVEVSVPGRAGRTGHRGVTVHRPVDLEAPDLTRRGGLPVTTVSRVVIDLAPRVAHRSLERVVEHAEHHGLLDHGRLRAFLVTNGPGARRLADVLAEPLTRKRSELERDFVALCAAHAIPRPLVNSPLLGYEVDFRWPGHDLVVEADGGEFHRTRRAFEEDRRRDAELLVAGHRVLRFTHARVTGEPAAVAQTVRRALGLDR